MFKHLTTIQCHVTLELQTQDDEFIEAAPLGLQIRDKNEAIKTSIITALWHTHQGRSKQLGSSRHLTIRPSFGYTSTDTLSKEDILTVSVVSIVPG